MGDLDAANASNKSPRPGLSTRTSTVAFRPEIIHTCFRRNNSDWRRRLVSYLFRHPTCADRLPRHVAIAPSGFHRFRTRFPATRSRFPAPRHARFRPDVRASIRDHRPHHEGNDVTVELGLDGSGTYENATGVGFLDHMLDLFAKHGGFDLNVSCDGDLHIDDHHTTEDIGITLGQAFAEALGDKKHITRYGHAYVPMDETLARTVTDLSGRFYLCFDADFSRPTVGDLSTEMVEHFWYSFAEHLRCNLHVSVLYGSNDHHKVEAIFQKLRTRPPRCRQPIRGKR